MSLRPPLNFEGDKTSQTIALKMSKSKPDSAIFMTDSHEDIKRKINKAYCPEGEIEKNPVLEYARYIIFQSFNRLKINSLIINRPQKFGGAISFKNYQELEKAFGEKKLHPMDLKKTVAEVLNKLIAPVRDHFENNQKAKELFEKVKNFKITR